MHKNFNNIGKICYGRGSFAQLGDIIAPVRSRNNGGFIFLIDDYFEQSHISDHLPLLSNDSLYFIDCSDEEPKTSQIDALRDEILAAKGLPSGVVGIGGGSILDIAKALALMLTNEGSSVQYQGLNLIKKPGIYHLGIPTISGTGAECSMTAVLTGPEKKLGLKCEWTVFDQVILDPDLIASVPLDKWFYTGMDTYIHCIESATGQFYNMFSKGYGDRALELCKEVYLDENSGQNAENDEKLMIASLFGGLSLTYSEVGICHALSYGLGFVLGMRHCYANCVAFQHLGDFYPQGVRDFKAMLQKHKIELPQGLSKTWTEEQIEAMAQISYRLDHMWNHALGYGWKEKFGLDSIKDLYRRL
jgi:3-deoxy-alpha-D-manno-octulosonate 8-oxidase